MENVKFDKIRYANVWEDAEMLISNFGDVASKRVLSIASSGDNCLALLAHNPTSVLAIDISAVQLYVTELKACAIEVLDYEDCEAFLGFTQSEDRSTHYSTIRMSLSEAARLYWDDHLMIIENGLIHAGKFEKYLRLFAKKVLPFIHSSVKVAELLVPKTAQEQRTFYERKWDTWKWRTLFKVFFSRFLMGRLGRDPQFLAQVDINVSQYILNQACDAISTTGAFDNHILRYCLTGSYGVLRPYYMQPEVYHRIKQNIKKLEYKQGLVRSLVADGQQFDLFNLSNIFEYMDRETFRDVAQDIKEISAPKAKFGYWNLMVNRSLASVLDQLQHGLVTGIDRGFFYSRFCLDYSIK